MEEEKNGELLHKPEASLFLKFRRHAVLYSIMAVLVVLLSVSLFTDRLDFITGKAVSGDKVKMEFYVMSQCPYGTEVEDAIAPVLEKMGDAVDFSINFIGGGSAESGFSSLHGQPEVDEDIRQLCAMKIAPEKYMDYIVCQNKDIRNAAANAETCAASAGIDFSELNACFEGAEGKQLLTESFAKANAAQAQGSPTIIVNGNDYNSGRDALSFQKEICKYARWHSECSEMPECTADTDCVAQPDKEGKCDASKCTYSDPVQFEVVVVNDAKCGTACDTTGALQTTKALFKGANIRTVDVSSDEGKKLVSELGLLKAPAYLFGSSVTESTTWKARPDLASAFEQKGAWMKLLDQAVGANWWIDQKARNDYLKGLGITSGDNKPTLNLFVMSQCPYGVQAEDALKPVLDLFGDKIDFQLDYIVSDNGDGTFNSLHGQAETDEDIRQLCAKKIAPAKYLNYIACQNKEYSNVAGNWEKCAAEAGIDRAALKTCAEGADGKALLSASAKKASLFGASGSPTIAVEGSSYSGARTAPAFQAALCSAFDAAPSECGTPLAAAAEAAPAAGTGCGA